jgi:hypothetical protein
MFNLFTKKSRMQAGLLCLDVKGKKNLYHLHMIIPDRKGWYLGYTKTLTSYGFLYYLGFGPLFLLTWMEHDEDPV